MGTLRLALLLLSTSLAWAQLVTRINVGGAEFTDAGGDTWAADSGCTGSTFSVANPIADTADDTLYQSGRTAAVTFGCSYSVVEGVYSVTLKFAEVYGKGRGQRFFNVLVNGSMALSMLDVSGRVGAVDTAYTYTGRFIIRGGTASIVATRVSDAPLLQALEISYISALVSGTTAPSTCGIGQLFFDTDAAAGLNLFGCTAADTWTLLGAGGDAVLGKSNLTAAGRVAYVVSTGTLSQTGLYWSAGMLKFVCTTSSCGALKRDGTDLE